MNIIQQKIQTFRVTDRLVDLLLLFLSARIAIVIERIYNAKSWHVLDPVSFNFYALILIFVIWLILIQVFESDLVYRRVSPWNLFKNSIFISFIGVTTTITLDFLFKTELFKRSTISFCQTRLCEEFEFEVDFEAVTNAFYLRTMAIPL